MNTEDLPDFTGKVLSVGISGDDSSSPIAEPKWKMIGGRLCLTGVVPKKGSGSDWVEGIECLIAWDSVTDYLLFDSPEEYVKRIQIWDEDEENNEDENSSNQNLEHISDSANAV